MGNIALRMENIVKDFPGVRALNSVNFEARYNEVLALVGENGAGKSTLMKVLSGVWPYPEYQGSIYVNGEEKRFSGTKDAESSGIAIIYQELNLIGDLTVAENILMDRQNTGVFGQINWSSVYSEAQKYLDMLEVDDVKPTDKICDLTVGKQQLVEIAKALSTNAKIIIFDEPTSALSEAEASTLFKTIRRLRDSGVCGIYISHKMDEIAQIADRIAILRDGETIGESCAVDEISLDEIINRMVGRKLNDMYPKENFTRGRKVLEVRDFRVSHPFIPGENIVKGVSFEAYEGEILGIAGLMGSGRSELVTGIFGAFASETSGEVLIDGKSVHIKSPRDAIELGIALITEDRKTFGIIPGQSVSSNMMLCSLESVSNAMGIIDRGKERTVAEDYVNRLSIKVPSLEVSVDKLSGGNQQKVIVSKWLNTKPRILILDEPTRGIDVGAKVEIYRIMNSLVKQGVVVIMISSELQEVVGMSDRVLVMAEGELKACLTKEEISREAIMKSCIKTREGRLR